MRAQRRSGYTACAAVFLFGLPFRAPAQNRTISAQARAALASVIVVERVDIGPVEVTDKGYGRAPVTIQAKNISQKAIYAYGYSLTATYADSSTELRDRQGVDLLAVYIQRSQLPPAQQRLLPPLLRRGEAFTHPAGSFPLDDDKAPPIMVEASITSVIFEDRTAVGDSKDIQRFFDSRKDQVEFHAGFIEDLKLLLQADDPLKAVEARAEDLAAGRARGKDGRIEGLTILTDPQGKEIGRRDSRHSRAEFLKSAVSGPKVDRQGLRDRITAKIGQEERYLQILRPQSLRAEAGQ